MSYEVAPIRIDNAVATTTSAPTTAAEGIEIWPKAAQGGRHVHLLLQKAASSGTRTLRVKLYGYISALNTVDANGYLTPVATSGKWYEVYDTGSTVLSSAADFNCAFFLEGLADYSRLDTEIVTNGGTGPTVTSAIAFGRKEQRQ